MTNTFQCGSRRAGQRSDWKDFSDPLIQPINIELGGHMLILLLLSFNVIASTQPCEIVAGSYAEARTLQHLTISDDCTFDISPELTTGRHPIRFTSLLRYSTSMLGAWVGYGQMVTGFGCNFPADIVLYPKDHGEILQGYFRYPRFFTPRCSFSGGGKQNLTFVRQD